MWFTGTLVLIEILIGTGTETGTLSFARNATHFRILNPLLLGSESTLTYLNGSPHLGIPEPHLPKTIFVGSSHYHFWTIERDPTYTVFNNTAHGYNKIGNARIYIGSRSSDESMTQRELEEARFEDANQAQANRYQDLKF